MNTYRPTKLLESAEEVAMFVERRGFLPFFHGEIEDFSLEECVAPRYWFPDDEEGVWEWKSAVIAMADCAYGKFYRQKACWVSMAWFPDLVNYRRQLYPLTADEVRGLDILQRNESLLSHELKRMCGYTSARAAVCKSTAEPALAVEPSHGKKRGSFETIINKLQMSGRVLISNFEYSTDRRGNSYGWGRARYCTPEAFFGTYRMQTGRTPEQSRQLLEDYLIELLPTAERAAVQRILG